MSENKNTDNNVVTMPTGADTTAKDKKQESEWFVKFGKPYTYEGKAYEGLDLSGLEDLTSEDIFEVSKQFQTGEYITPRPEADTKYCCMVAAIAAGVPEPFFDKLPARDGMKVRNTVQSFFQSES